MIVLPCGAGKTMVGMAAMAVVQQKTLILTSSLTSVHQWQRELLDKTTLTADANGRVQRSNKKPLGQLPWPPTKFSPTGPARTTTFFTLGYLTSKLGG